MIRSSRWCRHRFRVTCSAWWQAASEKGKGGERGRKRNWGEKKRVVELWTSKMRAPFPHPSPSDCHYFIEISTSLFQIPLSPAQSSQRSRSCRPLQRPCGCLPWIRTLGAKVLLTIPDTVISIWGLERTQDKTNGLVLGSVDDPL
jgi:hypothetical protein